MGFKTDACKCPICGKRFMAEAKHARFRVPSCSRKCEQERRHSASRDVKWNKQIQSIALYTEKGD